MAQEILHPNGDVTTEWGTTGANHWDEINDPVASANDGTYITATSKDLTDEFDLDDSIIIDSNVISQVDVKVRYRSNGASANNSLDVDWIIGGTLQGTTQRIVLVDDGAWHNITFNDVGWNSDWTASEMDGAQINITSIQAGMPTVLDFDVSAIEIVIAYSTGGNIFSTSGNLFITGHKDISTSGDLFTTSHEIISSSGDSFIQGYNIFQASGNLYIKNYGDLAVSGDLYTEGYGYITNSSNLFILGPQQIIASGDLFLKTDEYYDGILQGSNVIFYLPCDTDPLEEIVENKTWIIYTGDVDNVTSIVVSGIRSDLGAPFSIGHSGSYPDLTGVSGLCLAFWLENFSLGFDIKIGFDDTQNYDIDNGIRVLYDSFGPKIIQCIASGFLSPSTNIPVLNDPTFLVVDIRYSGGTTWLTRYSTNGSDWSSPNSITFDKQFGDDIYAKIILEGLAVTDSTWDEIILWADTTIFTAQELVRLYELGDIHADPMTSYFEHGKFISNSYDLFTYGQNNIEVSGNLFIHGQDTTEISGNLFINGHNDITISGDLFTLGPQQVTTSGTLFIKSIIASGLNTSGNLFISGPKLTTVSDDLFIQSYDTLQVSGNLYVQGYKDFAASGDFFISSLEQINASDNLFIHGHKIIPTWDDILFGQESEFLSENGIFAEGISVAILDQSKFVVAYRDLADSSHGTAKIGTVSGTDIIFGNESEFLSASGAYEISIAVIDESKFVITYRDTADSNNGTAKIGTVSGTTIIFGDEVEFSTMAYEISVTIIDTSKFVVAYRDGADSNHGTARIGTISGTNITFGNEAEFLSVGTAKYPSVTTLDTSKFAVIYRDSADSNHGTAKIGTVSGTDITFGNESEFLSVDGPYTISIATIDISKFIVVYRDAADSNHGTARVGMVSGTDITFGNEAEFLDIDGAGLTCVATFDTSKFIVIYTDIADLFHSTAKIGTVSGINIIFGNEVEFVSASYGGFAFSIANFNTSKFVIAYGDANDSNHGKAKIGIIPPSTTSSDLFIYGYNDVITSGDLFISGSTDVEQIEASGDLFIDGHGSTANDINLFTEGHVTASGNATLYINGHTITNNQVDLFISGYSVSSGNINLFTEGHIVSSGNVDLFLHGLSSESGQAQLFINGSLSISGDADLYIGGSIFSSGNISLYIGGSGTGFQTSVVSLIINGSVPIQSVVCPTLDPTASIQIPTTMISIYQDNIDALINQLGKNTTLIFQSQISPCPNCLYDNQRKRSNGVYNIGGPISFKRGRKCPYCKGKGVLETESQKCIKCLVKWRPRELENYGISIENRDNIVRLKTYLIYIDDLMRARTAIVSRSVIGMSELAVKRISDPIPVGLREDRYCISFWELL